MEVSSSSRSLHPLYLPPQPAPYHHSPPAALLAPTVPLLQQLSRSRYSMDPPFSEDEKRYLLAEALKTTRVPIAKILALINENGAEPAWSEMPLPYGRSMNSSIATWDALQQEFGANTSLLPTPTTSQKRKSSLDVLDVPVGGPEAKRRQSSGDAPIQARSIQPGPRPLTGSPRSFSPLGFGQQQKKRGRPSKADIEARNAAAIARGEVLPPLRPAAPKPRKEPKDSGASMVVRGLDIMGQTQSSPRLLAPSQPAQEHSFIGPGGAAIAPMTVASPPLESLKAEGDRAENEIHTSGRRTPSRPMPQPTDGFKTGTGSFQSVNPQFAQFRMTEPPTQHAPRLSNAPQAEADTRIAKEPQAELEVEKARSDI